MVTKLPLYAWVPTVSFSPLTDSFKYVCLWYMIVSKQALSYMKIRDVALLFKVSTDPNLFLQKSRITGSLQFLHWVVLHIFRCIVSHISQLSKVISCMNIKVKELSSWYEFRPSVSVIITMSYDIFGHYSNLLWSWHIFDRSCHISASCECILYSIWRRVCLNKSTRVPSDTTLRRNPTIS